MPDINPAADRHGHGHSHSHAWETDPVPAEAVEMDGIERFTLHSAGLDVGSATSHMTISRLVLKRLGVELSNRLVVTERTELYRSPVALTPYRSDTLIDAEELQHFFDGAYREAGFTPAQIDTGVVIVTGEAANRPNAEQFATMFAARSGSFICVAAGPHYEALLAAHGSGAAALSVGGRRVLNVDIGGGTTKLSVAVDGQVEHTGAFSVGARLVAHDGTGRLARVEPPGRWMLDKLGSSADVGDHIDEPVLAALATLMVDLVVAVIDQQERDPLLHRLWVTEEMAPALFDDVDTIVFSGGVSEYVYNRETTDFGDLGLLIGAELRHRLAGSDLGGRVAEPTQGMRATVLGAGQHSIQASGVTSFLDERRLPVAGLKVVSATVDGPTGLADDLLATSQRFEVDGRMPPVAYALAVRADPDYSQLRGIAEELIKVADPDAPLYVVVDADVAHALGRLLRNELGWSGPLVVVDSLAVGDLDYVDIGRPFGAVGTVPVTVKSLTFLTR